MIQGRLTTLCAAIASVLHAISLIIGFNVETVDITDRLIFIFGVLLGIFVIMVNLIGSGYAYGGGEGDLLKLFLFSIVILGLFILGHVLSIDTIDPGSADVFGIFLTFQILSLLFLVAIIPLQLREKRSAEPFQEARSRLRTPTPLNDYIKIRINDLNQPELYTRAQSFEYWMTWQLGVFTKLSRGPRYYLKEFAKYKQILQEWINNGYKSTYISRKDAFPLLEQLAREGDPIAKMVLEEEKKEEYYLRPGKELRKDSERTYKVWVAPWIGLLIAITGIFTPTFWNPWDALYWWGVQTSTNPTDVFDLYFPSISCFIIIIVLYLVLIPVNIIEMKKQFRMGKIILILGLLIFIVVWVYGFLLDAAYQASQAGNLSDSYDNGWGIVAMLIGPPWVMLGGYGSIYQQRKIKEAERLEKERLRRAGGATI
ncbi:MAG: hypothetical protein ACFFAS_06355 [Promethearchaeota archaeon]